MIFHLNSTRKHCVAVIIRPEVKARLLELVIDFANRVSVKTSCELLSIFHLEIVPEPPWYLHIVLVA